MQNISCTLWPFDLKPFSNPLSPGDAEGQWEEHVHQEAVEVNTCSVEASCRNTSANKLVYILLTFCLCFVLVAFKPSQIKVCPEVKDVVCLTY